ncbi:response regulator [Flavobacterium sp. Sd200]|uniref:LytR/AlgR family response regulator transcription factor n=1 Tax=Flavobacterium sp. Sd200 TaxID=2692211 RepID=UPI00137142D5|nr:LytTR family DNA-binding domain-containing protein [Flavobacterium sp. Sd200]MXN93263.1 response regulator [Flavobacterium sp. Sd200]
MTTVLIIEDEIKTARQIKTLIEQANAGFKVVHTVASVRTAVQWLGTNSVNLIFSDIQLADGLSFEIFRQVQTIVPVIFCTAFDEYAIQAFESNGIDYLLKPIEQIKLDQALAKYNNLSSLFSSATNYQNRLQATLNHLTAPYKTSLLIHHRDKIIPLKLEDVAFAHSENGIVALYTMGNSHYNVNHTLDELENMMNPDVFFKVNRQYIVNRKTIEVAEHYFSRRLLIKTALKTPAPIVVSKARTPAFIKWMGQ